MVIFGHKPSEIRKALVGGIAALLILLVALPLVGLPVAVSGVVAGTVAVLTSVSVYLTKPNVAAVIDSADLL